MFVVAANSWQLVSRDCIDEKLFVSEDVFRDGNEWLGLFKCSEFVEMKLKLRCCVLGLVFVNCKYFKTFLFYFIKDWPGRAWHSFQDNRQPLFVIVLLLQTSLVKNEGTFVRPEREKKTWLNLTCSVPLGRVMIIMMIILLQMLISIIDCFSRSQNVYLMLMLTWLWDEYCKKEKAKFLESSQVGAKWEMLLLGITSLCFFILYFLFWL